MKDVIKILKLLLILVWFVLLVALGGPFFIAGFIFSMPCHAFASGFIGGPLLMKATSEWREWVK